MGDVLKNIKKIITPEYEDYNILIEVAKAIPFLLLGLVISWIIAWVMNICAWIMSITLDSLIISVVFHYIDAPGFESVWNFIFSFSIMFCYSAMYLGAVFLLGLFAKPGLFLSALYLLMGVVLVFIYDPEMKYYIISSPLFNYIDFLQTECNFRLFNGPDIFLKSWSREYTPLEYLLFDIFIAFMTLFLTIQGYFKKFEI